jgi:predicted metal-dependent hydrolase
MMIAAPQRNAVLPWPTCGNTGFRPGDINWRSEFIDGMEVVIKRSARRKKTVSARLEGNTVIVQAPMRMSDRELKPIIENLKSRLLKKQKKEDLNKTEDLPEIAGKLNNKYFHGLAKFKSIEFVTNQNKRFGSCTPVDGTIRISDQLANLPAWVRDYVIVHELAHLLIPDHGNKFWSLVNRYPLTERARGYLLALGYLDTQE